MGSSLFSGFCERVLNLALPHQCPLCHVPLEHQGMCAPCWADLTFITSPACARCGYPFGFRTSTEASLCGACLQESPPFDQSRSVFVYTNTSKKLLFAFKHGRRLMLAPLLVRWLLARGNGFFEGVDMLIPVPLHWSRLWKRRFNQSALLAQAMGDALDITCYPTLLKRVRPTPSQGHMTPVQRFENVQGAFRLSKEGKKLIQGKTVLLIDDVYTTGATVKTCAKTLRQAGAKKVKVLTLLRVT